jgi:uncharacterized protein YqeY
MSITTKLQEDMKTAMKAKDKERLGTIRLLLAALKNEQIAERVPTLGEDAELTVLTRQAKQRRESITEYEKAGRQDLVDKEAAELVIIEGYLPKAFEAADVEALARDIIAEVGASTPKDIGAVMGKLMPKIKGRYDGRAAQKLVVGLLGGA